MASKTHEQRRFIRHPVEIPIQVWRNRNVSHNDDHSVSKDISYGGLAFSCETPWKQGTLLNLRVPLAPPFETRGQVAWCRPAHGVFEIGVEFIDSEEAYKAQMIEQVCQIEMYRSQLQKCGRDISLEEAAMEWIDRYAAEFREQCKSHERLATYH